MARTLWWWAQQAGGKGSVPGEAGALAPVSQAVPLHSGLSLASSRQKASWPPAWNCGHTQTMTQLGQTPGFCLLASGTMRVQ
jgi:hypothetical protein